jgi:hypothetical protein
MDVSMKIDSTRGSALASSEYMGAAEDDGVDLRRKFQDNYGVEIDFPTYYSDGGVIVPHVPNHILSLGFHTIPF